MWELHVRTTTLPSSPLLNNTNSPLFVRLAVYIDGTHQIALHATSKLDAGDELFLNYGDSYGRLLNMEGY